MVVQTANFLQQWGQLNLCLAMMSKFAEMTDDQT